jgi:uncharacterized sulfatase
VPFIAWWPGQIASGRESDTPAITLDIMPTLLSLAGVKLPTERPLDGIDLSPLLLRGIKPPARPLFWASLSNQGSRSEAIRDGEWKLVVKHPKAAPGSFENETLELYRLDQDAAEQHDLASRYPQRARQLRDRLRQWYRGCQATASDQPGGW